MNTQPLVHVVQEHSGCASACLAMILGLPLAQVKEEFHNLYWQGQLTTADYLRSKGYDPFTPTVCEPHQLYDGAIHLLAVPAINGAGLHHNIVVDTRFGEPIVLDPAKGFGEGSRYYVMPHTKVLDKDYGDEYDPNAFPLMAWFNELVITFD